VDIDALELMLGSVFDDGVRLGKYGKRDPNQKSGQWIEQEEWDREKAAAIQRWLKPQPASPNGAKKKKGYLKDGRPKYTCGCIGSDPVAGQVDVEVLGKGQLPEWFLKLNVPVQLCDECCARLDGKPWNEPGPGVARHTFLLEPPALKKKGR